MATKNKTKGIRDPKTGQMRGSEKNITPTELLEAFEAYQLHCKKNPKIKEVPNTKNNSVIRLNMEVPLSKIGFEVYLIKKGITRNGKEILYNRDNRYAEFNEVNEYIDSVTYDDQLSGAMANVFNPIIVARKLGLTDKQEVTTEEKVKISFVKAKGK